MKIRSLVLGAALAASSLSLVPSYAAACEGEGHAAAYSKVSVPELATLIEKKSVTIFDANSEATRTKEGVIPGAKLLTSAAKYDPKELPADKTGKLVFYCANEKCTASEVAAKKASDAGYTNVSVLPDGILGWKKAGRNTAAPNS